jgi:hypothetical protein
VLEHLLTGEGIPRGARKLFAKGRPAPATIVGIRVSSRGASEPVTDRWEYGLRVEGDAGSSVLGVRQLLAPQRERAHLGARVVVRHDLEGRAAVDWPETMAAWGVEGVMPSAADWAMVEPPEEGSIDDRRRSAARKRIARGELVEIELVDATRSAAMGGALAAWDLRIRAAGAEHELSGVDVPAYAVHLLAPPMRLIGVIGEKAIEVDWERSAAEVASRGKATGFDFDALLPPIAEPDGTIEDLDAWMAEFDQFKPK